MRRPLVLLSVLLGLLMPLAVWATPGLRVSADTVRAGETLVIEWSSLPAGTYEAELELSLDGGRWLRISPELEARERRFVWTVPAGISGAARVRLRFGREHEEHEGGMVALTIETPAHPLGPAPARRSREWWSVGEPDARTPARCLDHAPSLAPILAQSPAIPTDPVPAVAPIEFASTVAHGPLVELRTAPPARAFAPPWSTPLRI
jgi:hypothetical protein